MSKPHSNWPEVALGDVCEFKYGKSLAETDRAGGDVPVFGSNGQVGTHNEALTAGPTIVVGRKGSFGEVNFSPISCWPIDTTYYVDETCTKADLRWLRYRLAALGLNQLNRAAAVPGLNREDAYRKRLLFPPLPEQRRIAAILDKADELRAKRRAALKKLDELTQSIFLDMFGDPATNPKGWPMRMLGSVGDITTGKTPPTKNKGMFGGNIPFATPSDLDVGLEYTERTITDAGAEFTKVVRAGSALVGCIGNIGKMAKTPVATAFNQQINAIEWSDAINDDYGLAALRFAVPQMLSLASSTTVPILNKSAFCKVRIPVPPCELQNDFASRIASIQRLRSEHRESLGRIESLFACLQHRAFRGEL